jgi:hypothetical protein
VSTTGIREKRTDTTHYDTCPKCASRDLRGPIDTTPTLPNGHFTRSWFCRTCWWDTAIKLRDSVWLAEKVKEKAKPKPARARA